MNQDKYPLLFASSYRQEKTASEVVTFLNWIFVLPFSMMSETIVERKAKNEGVACHSVTVILVKSWRALAKIGRPGPVPPALPYFHRSLLSSSSVYPSSLAKRNPLVAIYAVDWTNFQCLSISAKQRFECSTNTCALLQIILQFRQLQSTPCSPTNHGNLLSLFLSSKSRQPTHLPCTLKNIHPFVSQLRHPFHYFRKHFFHCLLVGLPHPYLGHTLLPSQPLLFR